MELPRARCMAWVVVLTSLVMLSALPSLIEAKTPEELLAEAITGSAGRTVTYVVNTRITLTKELPAIPLDAKLTIEGSCGAERCVINGAGRFKIFFSFGTECRITLRKLKLENALEGALHTKCHVMLHQCTFSKNKAGGLVILLGTATWSIEDSLFEHNDAASLGRGAAIFTTSTGRGRVLRTTFRGNRAADGDGFGGAIYIGSGGDGINHVFKSSIFDSNQAKAGGGAIYVQSVNRNTAGPNPMRVYFVDSTFEKNVVTAGNGGAVAMTSPVVASFCGGAIANKQNRAVKGNDIALDQSGGDVPIAVSFCPEKPAALSADFAAPATIVTNCNFCTAPNR